MTPLLPHPSPSSQFVPHLKALKQEQMEQILDRFDAREEVYESHVIVNQGDTVGAEGEGGDRAAVAGRRCMRAMSS